MSTVSEGRHQQHRSRPGLSDVSGIGYGVRIEGRVPGDFRRYLWRARTGAANDATVLKLRYRVIRTLPEVDELWVGSRPGPHKTSRFSLFRHPGGVGLRIDCQGRGLFRITGSTIQIEWLPGGTSAAHYFFTHALPLWLEFNGVPVLHASAVSIAGRAMAFVGPSGMGKSTLCDALVRRQAAFVADDGLALAEDSHGNWKCSAGPPLIRLWPSAIDRGETPRIGTLSRVHERFDKRLLPLDGGNIFEWPHDIPELSRVYVLERQSSATGEVRVVPCTTSESLIRLVEHSLVGEPAATMGWVSRRLRKLARVAARTSVKRLIYPSGYDCWEPLREAILDDIQAR